jgi:hypothetical protein
MNIIKKIAAIACAALAFSDSSARYMSTNPFATGGGCHHSPSMMHHPIRRSVLPCPCHSSANSSCPLSKGVVSNSNGFSKGEALVCGAFASIFIGLGLHQYFEAKRGIAYKTKIMEDFELINNRLQILNVHNANFLIDTNSLMSEISEFDDKYQETLRSWYFGKSEVDILLYGNLWPAEFIVELKNFQIARERLETSFHPYALEDTQKSLEKLKIMADGFYRICKDKLSEEESSKFISKMITGVGVLGLAGTVFAYANANVGSVATV